MTTDQPHRFAPVEIRAVLVGQPLPYGPNGELSSYVKHPVEGTAWLTMDARVGNAQNVPSVETGYSDSTIHHFPFENYAFFAAERPEHAETLSAYAFAENISTIGVSEWDVCLGDRFRIGTTEVELSQGRTPCWRLGHRFRDPSMVEAVVKTRRAGWYYRTLAPGRFTVGDQIELLDRPYPQWPVARAFGIIVAGDDDPKGLAELMLMDRLGDGWRRRALAKYRKAEAAGG